MKTMFDDMKWHRATVIEADKTGFKSSIELKAMDRQEAVRVAINILGTNKFNLEEI